MYYKQRIEDLQNNMIEDIQTAFNMKGGERMVFWTPSEEQMSVNRAELELRARNIPRHQEYNMWMIELNTTSTGDLIVRLYSSSYREYDLRRLVSFSMKDIAALADFLRDRPADAHI